MLLSDYRQELFDPWCLAEVEVIGVIGVNTFNFYMKYANCTHNEDSNSSWGLEWYWNFQLFLAIFSWNCYFSWNGCFCRKCCGQGCWYFQSLYEACKLLLEWVIYQSLMMSSSQNFENSLLKDDMISGGVQCVASFNI